QRLRCDLVFLELHQRRRRIGNGRHDAPIGTRRETPTEGPAYTSSLPQKGTAMKPTPFCRQKRRGAIIPLAAILMIPLMGMLAFAIDTGYIIMARSELQNAADAAALAAAEQLSTYYVQYYLPSADQTTVLSNAKTTARSFASKFASFHKAGNTASVVADTTN